MHPVEDHINNYQKNPQSVRMGKHSTGFYNARCMHTLIPVMETAPFLEI